MASSNGKTTLYMIRHGEPHEQFKPLYYGQMDVPLSELGERQSRAVAERLEGVPFEVVYSSDLQRAGLMADALADPRDLPVRRLEVFRERNLGMLQGMTLAQMEERHPKEFKDWNADRIYHRIEGGENYEDLRDRVVPHVEHLIQSFEGKRIALVCHAGPIRVTLGHVLGMPLDRVFNFTLDYGSINVIEFDAGPRLGEGPGLAAGSGPRVKLVNG